MKIKTSHLIIILIILLGIIIIVKIIKERNSLGNLKTEFFMFDSGSITSFVIYPKMNKDLKYSIDYKNDRWGINNPALQHADVDPQLLDRAIKEFFKLKPSRFVTDSKKDWGKYGVDSSGTLLEIIMDNGLKYSIILGNLTFQNDQYINTYVRLPEEKDVYTAEAYFEGSFRGIVNDWRLKVVIPTQKQNWQSIVISQPKKADIVLYKKNDLWYTGNLPTDTLKLNTLFALTDKINNAGLIDFKVTKPAMPNVTIIITDNSQGEVKLDIQENSNIWIMSSSINSGNYFFIENTLANDLIKLLDELN
jgi:hypothetical protein